MLRKIIRRVLKKYNDFININIIKKSDYFSKDYYLLENPNIKMDPAKHYYYYGFKEGLSPNYNFSTNKYLKANRDIEQSGINPLVHYLKYGKKENRKIFNDDGYNIEELYYKTYNNYYNYKFYINNNEEKKVNLFIEDNYIDNSEIINHVINYCKKNNYNLRIIYFNYDISKLKNIIDNSKINISFVNNSNNDYIFINKLDEFFCTGLKTAFALFNSKIIKANIYVYLESFFLDDINSYILTNLCNSYRFVFITNNKSIIDSDTYSVCYYAKEKLEGNHLYYYSSDNSIIGLLLLNEFFLNYDCAKNKYELYLVNCFNKFHFDMNVKTKNIKSNSNYISDSLFYLTDKENGASKIYAKLKKDNNMINFIFIKSEDLSEIEKISLYNNLNKNHNNKDIMCLKDIILKTRSGD